MRDRIAARVVLTLLLGAVAMPVSVAAKSAAGKSAGDQGGNLATRVEGSFDNPAGAGSFDGTLTLNGFARRGDRIGAAATLEGTFTDGAGKELGDLPEQAVTISLDPAAVSATCQRAKLTLDAGAVDGAGVHARLQPVELEIDANTVPGHKLDGLLCELAKLVQPAPDAGAVAQQLDRILDALE
ncbi:MAG TPA: hypothetical protein VGV61_12785 [Thermoanaerobaculia bacterium]|jgi:hypothetical protein|nr:hypothetical protein [Thermoanaerobaculia bacterium]